MDKPSYKQAFEERIRQVEESMKPKHEEQPEIKIPEDEVRMERGAFRLGEGAKE